MGLKVVVAHPGQQHSIKVAEALEQNGCLLKYMTAVYDSTKSPIIRLTRFICSKKDIYKLENRTSNIIPIDKVKLHYTFLSLAVILLGRIKYTKRFSIWLDRFIADRFGVKVAKYAIKVGADAVICFSGNERTCFGYLESHSSKIKKIVDFANPPIAYMRYIFDKDIEKTGKDYLIKETPRYWNDKYVNKYYPGKADLYLAPSSFVKKGLLWCGIDENKIKILHYGTNFPVIKRTQKIPQKMVFVYVGHNSYNKGVHYLLKAFSELAEQGVKLKLVGAINDCNDLYQLYSKFDNIEFVGRVPHEKVRQILLESNVFVMATLAEGQSLSCLEALSCGLPIVSSTNTGVDDLIEKHNCGFIFEPENTERLKKIIVYLNNNKSILPQLSENAISLASLCTWEKYSSNLIDALDFSE